MSFYIVRLLLSLLLTLCYASVSQQLRTFRCRAAQSIMMSAAPRWTSSNGKVNIRFASPSEIGEVAEFLADSMYSSAPIPKGQRKELIRLEDRDLRSRYAMRKYTSQLLVAEERDSGIVGCVGIDNRALDIDKKKIDSITSWTEPENIILVIANLAVRPSFRGQGIGKELVKQCEILAKEFSVGRIGLTVESTNTPAKKLYLKQGFKVIFEDTDATCVVPGEFNLRTAPCINICMIKDLKNQRAGLSKNNPIAGIFSGLFGTRN